MVYNKTARDLNAGDEITFIHSAYNRNIVYTVAEINDAEVTITTPSGFGPPLEDVFTYRLDVAAFDALGPRTLEAAG